MKNNKKFGILILSAIFLTTLSVEAQNTCPVLNGTQLLQCTGSGNCVNNLSQCPKVPISSSSSSNGAGASAVLSQKCSGLMLAKNTADAQECADLAEQQGLALGYNIECEVNSTSYEMQVPANAKSQLEANGYTNIKAVPGTDLIAVPVTDNIGTCTINGQSGFDPRTLVGYSSNQSGYVVPDAITGTRLAYGNGFQLNSMWSTVPCSITDSVQGTVGGGTLVGFSSCGAGASKYFGSSNPANWNSANRPTNNNWKNGGSSAGTVNNGYSSVSGIGTGREFAPNTSAQNLLNLVNRLIADTRAILRRANGPASLVGSGSIPNTTGTVPTTPIEQPNYSNSVVCDPKIQTRNALFSSIQFGAIGGSNPYTWVAPGATLTYSGAGRDFSTSYSKNGIYYVTVSSQGTSDTCKVTVNAPN